MESPFTFVHRTLWERLQVGDRQKEWKPAEPGGGPGEGGPGVQEGHQIPNRLRSSSELLSATVLAFPKDHPQPRITDRFQCAWDKLRAARGGRVQKLWKQHLLISGQQIGGPLSAGFQRVRWQYSFPLIWISVPIRKRCFFFFGC